MIWDELGILTRDESGHLLDGMHEEFRLLTALEMLALEAE